MAEAQATTPQSSPPSTPLEMSSGSAEARVLHQKFTNLEGSINTLVEQNKSLSIQMASMAGLATDITHLKTQLGTVATSVDTKYDRVLYGGIAAVVLVVGMLITGYFKLEDKLDSSSEKLRTKVEDVTKSTDAKFDDVHDALIRTDTKLEDLLQRLPPATTPLRH